MQNHSSRIIKNKVIGEQWSWVIESKEINEGKEKGVGEND